MDAKTEERIFNNLFGPNGLLKEGDTTVILATNAGESLIPYFMKEISSDQSVHRISYADNIIVLDRDGHLTDEGTFHDVHALAKEITMEGPWSVKTEKVEEAPVETTLGSSRPLSMVETPKGSERRTGDMTVYKYYVRAVRPGNALMFAVACAIFVVCLSLPRKSPSFPFLRHNIQLLTLGRICG